MTKAHGERDVIIQAGQKREVLLYQKHNRPTTAEALCFQNIPFNYLNLLFVKKGPKELLETLSNYYDNLHENNHR